MKHKVIKQDILALFPDSRELTMEEITGALTHDSVAVERKVNRLVNRSLLWKLSDKYRKPS